MAVYRTLTREIPAYAGIESSATAPAAHRRLGLLCGLAVRFGLVLMALFAVLLTLAHVPAYQNDALHALVSPSSGCALPCWNQIEPGITTTAEAVSLLQTDSNIADYHVSEGQISWWWNGDQSPLLDASGRAFHGRLETALVNGQERVTSMVLDTTVLMGDVRLTLGDPDSVTLHTVPGRDTTQRAGIVYVAHYHDLSIFTMLDCPMTVNDFWRAPGYIAFGTPNLIFEGETFEFDALPDWFFRDQAPGCSVR
jgi:hypothetical protein